MDVGGAEIVTGLLQTLVDTYEGVEGWCWSSNSDKSNFLFFGWSRGGWTLVVCCIILLFTFPSATDDGTENVSCAFTDTAVDAMTTGCACTV
jgi:hypothetical protein